MNDKIIPSQSENWGSCAPAFIPGTPPYLHDSIFDGFGNNWRWASIDYRGVARVHTFEPHFTPNGRIEVPPFKANSALCEAFDIVDKLTEGLQPMLHKRDMRLVGIKSVPTDRFGVGLDDGADPVEAADVVINKMQGADPGEVLLDEWAAKLQSDVTDPKYKVNRTEHCRCDLTGEQLGELLRAALGIDAEQNIKVFAYNTGGYVSLTVEWVRAL